MIDLVSVRNDFTRSGVDVGFAKIEQYIDRVEEIQATIELKTPVVEIFLDSGYVCEYQCSIHVNSMGIWICEYIMNIYHEY